MPQRWLPEARVIRRLTESVSLIRLETPLEQEVNGQFYRSMLLRIYTPPGGYNTLFLADLGGNALCPVFQEFISCQLTLRSMLRRIGYKLVEGGG